MTAPLSPRGQHPHAVILDETTDWVRSVELVMDTGHEGGPLGRDTLECSHLNGTITVEFASDMASGFRRLWRQWEEAIAARRTFTLARLADDLGKPLDLVRRQADAVDRVLEAAGIADGYGQLAPQAIRPPVPAPPRQR